jgi:hypothetical protein
MSRSSATAAEEPSAPLDATGHPAGAEPNRPERARWRGPEVVLQPDLVAATAAARGLLEALGLDLPSPTNSGGREPS